MNRADAPPGQAGDPGENERIEYYLAVLDGDAPDDPAARAAAAKLQLPELHALLVTSLYRFDCPAPDELVEYARQKLDGFRTGEIATHLETCPHCSGELAAWHEFQAALAPGRPEPANSAPAEPLRWIKAWLQPPAATLALRGNAQDIRVYVALDWQLLVMVEEAVMPLNRLTGQVVPVGDGGQVPHASVLLYRAFVEDDSGSEELWQTPLDELGSFSFDSLPSDTYELHVAIDPETRIVVDNLVIGEQTG